MMLLASNSAGLVIVTLEFAVDYLLLPPDLLSRRALLLPKADVRREPPFL